MQEKYSSALEPHLRKYSDKQLNCIWISSDVTQCREKKVMKIFTFSNFLFLANIDFIQDVI